MFGAVSYFFGALATTWISQARLYDRLDQDLELDDAVPDFDEVTLPAVDSDDVTAEIVRVSSAEQVKKKKKE